MNHEEILQARIKASRYEQLCRLMSNATLTAIAIGVYCLWYFNA